MERCKIKIISQTQSGRVFRCYSCNRIHIEFKNLYFTFTDLGYKDFKNYFLNFNEDYWENTCKDFFCRRKIVVPVGHKNISLLFNGNEIKELKNLFSSEFSEIKKSFSVNSLDFESKFSAN